MRVEMANMRVEMANMRMRVEKSYCTATAK